MPTVQSNITLTDSYGIWNIYPSQFFIGYVGERQINQLVFTLDDLSYPDNNYFVFISTKSKTTQFKILKTVGEKEISLTWNVELMDSDLAGTQEAQIVCMDTKGNQVKMSKVFYVTIGKSLFSPDGVPKYSPYPIEHRWTSTPDDSPLSPYVYYIYDTPLKELTLNLESGSMPNYMYSYKVQFVTPSDTPTIITPTESTMFPSGFKTEVNTLYCLDIVNGFVHTHSYPIDPATIVRDPSNLGGNDVYMTFEDTHTVDIMGAIDWSTEVIAAPYINYDGTQTARPAGNWIGLLITAPPTVSIQNTSVSVSSGMSMSTVSPDTRTVLFWYNVQFDHETATSENRTIGTVELTIDWNPAAVRPADCYKLVFHDIVLRTGEDMHNYNPAPETIQNADILRR